METTKISAEALEAAEESRREGRRIYNRERARRSLVECENEAIALALDRAQAEERERLRVAVKSMRYDGLWGGQRRIGWELGRNQALEIIKANDDASQAEVARLTEAEALRITAARAQDVREGIEMAASSHQILAGNPELRKREADLIRALAAPETQDGAGVTSSECGIDPL